MAVNQVKTDLGWRPAIPMPLFIGWFGRNQCVCGKKFRKVQKYREHYAVVHILIGDRTEPVIRPVRLPKKRPDGL